MAPPKKQCSPEERVRLDLLAEKRRLHRLNNPETTKKVQDKARKKFYKDKKEKVLKWNREYRAKNYEDYLKRTRKERKQRRKVDPGYVIKDRLRARLRSALKRKGALKQDTTARLLSCNVDDFIKMFGAVPEGCVIDHIFPFELYDLHSKASVKKVMHWSNLQILTEAENRNKGTQLPTKAMADKTLQCDVWPDGLTWDSLPDQYDGWVNGLRMQ
tara:strand:- start:105 stop:749 length:645 start_codon:yes stop_codon:yes gene_type:complete